MDKFSSGFYEKMRKESGSAKNRGDTVQQKEDSGIPTLSFDKSQSMHQAQRKADELAEQERRGAKRYALQTEYAKRNGGVNLCDPEEVKARDNWVSRNMEGI